MTQGPPIPLGGSETNRAGRRRLTVLVVGTHDWAIEQSISSIEADGHTALRCHEPGEPAFPCNALIEGRTCPLDVGFDAVLTVRARPLDAPTTGETGVTCALHAGAPLVVGGIIERNPFEPYAARVVDQRADLAEALLAVTQEEELDVREGQVAWRP